jgi:nicotinamidase/pyrazinamidase
LLIFKTISHWEERLKFPEVTKLFQSSTGQQSFELVVATQDWHPKKHKSFSSNHPGKRNFEEISLNGLKQVLWPDHCVQATRGADFHPELHTQKIEAIFRKGMDIEIDSYSGFYDNGYRKSTGLAGYLKERKVRAVYVCGLAGDYCVYYTAKDALKENFQTYIIEDATRSINSSGFEDAKKDITQLGGEIITSHQC